MKKYTITAEVITKYEIDIEAKNEEEAKSISNGMDLNNWSAVEDINFEILSVEEEEDECM
jgi:hypothetical protein